MGAGAFAASNSSFISIGTDLAFGTDAPDAAVYRTVPACAAKTGMCSLAWQKAATPILHGQAAQGVFSLAGRFITSLSGKNMSILVSF